MIFRSRALAASVSFTACTTFNRVRDALTGRDAALTVQIVGLTAKTTVEDADKLWHAKLITDAQWHAIGGAYDRFLPVYRAEAEALINAHAAGGDAPASASLADLYRVVIAAYSAAKTPTPATATPAK